MSKVGIITFHCADNFGAVLQAYALSQAIRGFGKDVEIIDFVPPFLRKPYNLFFNHHESMLKKGIVFTIKRMLGNIYRLNLTSTRIRNFKEFRSAHLQLSDKMYKHPLELVNDKPAYDFYVTGSDQVWNPHFFSRIGSSYFLDFALEGSKRISYAASVTGGIDEDYYEYFSTNLKNFDFISVREMSSRKLINKFTDKEVHVTLDPTLLIGKDRWLKISTPSTIKGKYVLVYDMVKDPVTVSLANRAAEHFGCRIISYSNSKGKGYINWHGSFSSCNPTEFLGLCENAEFIITSSFHGTAFAVIFNKPFYTVPNPITGSRMIDFLNMLELNCRIIRDSDGMHMFDDHIDYDKVNIKLAALRESSLSFLKNALNCQ
jgi:hypothetical protein